MKLQHTLAVLLLAVGTAVAGAPRPYTADGRLTASELTRRVDDLARAHGWQAEVVYQYPGSDAPAIRAWRTQRHGPALWLLAGIHGEEPAGPNAIARSIPQLARLAAAGVPMVVIPLCNPMAYTRNWRYPTTEDRNWQGPGYSVGDSEYLLPDLETGTRPRAAAAKGPETRALTSYALRTTSAYPPELVIDLHEDELSQQGYIYIQAPVSGDSAVATEIVRLLQVAGMPLRLSGLTRFGEPVVNGLSTRDDKGQPFRDGSIDELLSARDVFLLGQKTPGPAARTVIVVETPAYAGSQLTERVAAHAALLNRIADLWRLNKAAPK